MFDDKVLPKIYQFRKVPFSLTDSPFKSIAVILHHAKRMQEKYPAATTAVRLSTYVDDVLHSVDTEEEAISLQKEIVEFFASCGMVIKKWSFTTFSLKSHFYLVLE